MSFTRGPGAGIFDKKHNGVKILRNAKKRGKKVLIAGCGLMGIDMVITLSGDYPLVLVDKNRFITQAVQKAI